MDSKKYDLIIRTDKAYLSSATNPKDITVRSCDIGIKSGKIVEIKDQLDPATADKFYDATGKQVLPGLIDSQVHFRDPGSPQKEDFGSGSKGAILGGVTAVFDMPNTKPNTSTVERFNEKRETVAKKTFCDFALFAGATNDNSKELPEIENLPGCCGIKIFMGSSTGDLLVSEDQYLANVLRAGKKMISVHCEDEATLEARKSIAIEKANPIAHPEWRNEESALKATQRIVSLAREAGRRIHTLHITTKQEMEFLKDCKDIATVEILPQHLYFHAPDCYEQLGSLAQMNPPIRGIEHQEALKQALIDGIVDVVASDHAPHTLEEKSRTYPECPSGLVGVQTIVPLMLNFVNQGLLNLEKLCLLMSVNPAQIFKAKGKGGIFIGQDADFTIVDINKKQTVSNKDIASRAGWSPYDGHEFTGWPVATIIRGVFAMENGQALVEPGFGQPLQF